MYSRVPPGVGIALVWILAGSTAQAMAAEIGDTVATGPAAHAWPLLFEPAPVLAEGAHLLAVHDNELVITPLESRQEQGGIHNIGRWDGAAWKPMGELVLQVRAFAEFESRLVAGGVDRSRDDRRGALAAWQDGAWESFGHEIEGAVLALVVWRDRLVIGGRFNVRGHPDARNLIAWDGRAWHELPVDGLGGGDNTVCALAVLDGDLVIGGLFAEVDGVAATNVARFDGRRWHAVGGGTNGRVEALAGHGGTLFAAGDFKVAGGSPLPTFAMWDGRAWRGPGGPFTDVASRFRVRSLKNRGGRLLVAGALPGGLGALATWDGRAWEPVGAGLAAAADGEIFRSRPVAIAGNARVHPGDWELADPFSLVTWTGERWQWLHAPTPGLVSRRTKLTLHRGELVAAGRLGPQASTKVETWRDGRWLPLATSEVPMQPLRLRSTGRDLYVLGGQGGRYQDSTCVLLRLRDGVMQQMGPALGASFLGSAMLAVSDEVVAVIAAREAVPDPAASPSLKPEPAWSLFTLRDEAWHESALPDGCEAVTAAAAAPDGFFVAGVVDSAGTVAPRIWLRRDARWRQVWSHPSGVVPFLQETGRGLWAAVQRAQPDSLMPPPLLHWEGGRWHAVGAPLPGREQDLRSADVQAMTIHRGEPVVVVRHLLTGDGDADRAATVLVWREDRWRRVAGFLPHVVGLLGGDERLWVAQSESGPPSNLPLTWTDRPLVTGQEIAPLLPGWWRDARFHDTPVSFVPPRSRAAVRIAPPIGLPAMPAVGDTSGADPWPSFEAGAEGWVACPREHPVDNGADSGAHEGDGSLTAMLIDYRLIGFNYHADGAGIHKVSFRWRLTSQDVPLRADPQVTPVASFVVGSWTESEDAAYRHLRPGAVTLDEDGFAQATLTVAVRDSSLVRFQLDCGYGHERLEVEDFRVETVDEKPADDFQRVVEFLTTRYRRADGTTPERQAIPEVPAARDAARRHTDRVAELLRLQMLDDRPQLPAEVLAARREAQDRSARAIDSLLVNRRHDGVLIGWLPGNTLYCRGAVSRRLLSGLGGETDPAWLRNLGPRTAVVIDLRRGPVSADADQQPGNEAPEWVDALRLASRLTAEPVAVVAYRGDEGFPASPQMKPFVTGAAAADDRVVFRAQPGEGWHDRGPLVVLTDPWSDALTVLALKGRPGVTIVGEPARALQRPATEVVLNGGSLLRLPTGVVTTPDGVNVLVDGVAPDVPVTFTPERDPTLERGLEILRQ
ncbi:MAG: hypothetical protein IPK64_04065 [bacterium]|nr:hypothetical protein [bacterium]